MVSDHNEALREKTRRVYEAAMGYEATRPVLRKIMKARLAGDVNRHRPEKDRANETAKPTDR